MKGKQLRKAVLLGIAMSMAVWTTGMAATTVGPITETYNENNKTALGNVTVENGAESASIQIGHENTQDVIVNIKTETNGVEPGDILLDSDQYGIRTENKSTGTIQLDAAGNNTISFADGSGISADSGVNIELKAVGDNVIEYTKNDIDHDGINAGANNTGGITLQGTNNIINVRGNDSDGIYTDKGSSNNTDLIAETGSNRITAGNNGIDHRGDGSVKLQAQYGSNIIHAGEGQAKGALEGDGIRVAGNGNNVTLDAQYNEIFGHDEGIYVAEGANTQIDITATGEDGNYIKGDDNGIEVVGTGKVSVNAVQGINTITASRFGSFAEGTGSIVTLSAKKNKIIVTGNENSETTTGIYAGTDGEQVITSDTTTIEVSSVAGRVIGVHSDDGGFVDIDSDLLTVKSQFTGAENGEHVYGILAGNIGNNMSDGAVDIDAVKNITVEVTSEAATDTEHEIIAGVSANKGADVDLMSSEGNINVTVHSDSASRGIVADEDASVTAEATQGAISVNVDSGSGINAEVRSNVKLTAGTDILIQSFKEDDTDSTGNMGIRSVGGNIDLVADDNVTITAVNDNVMSDGWGVYSTVQGNPDTSLNIDSGKNLSVYGAGKNAYGVWVSSNKEATINGDAGIDIKAIGNGEDTYGLYTDNTNTQLTSGGNVSFYAANQNTYNPSWDDYYWNTAVSNVSYNNNVLIDGKNIFITAVGTDAWTQGISSEAIDDGSEGNDVFTVKADENIFVNVENNGGGTAYGVKSYGEDFSKDAVNINTMNVEAGTDITVNVQNTGAGAFGVYNRFFEEDGNGVGLLNMTAQGDITIIADSNGSWSRGVYTEFADTNLTGNTITVKGLNTGAAASGYGIYASHYGNIDNETKVSLYSVDTNTVYGSAIGIRADVEAGATDKATTNVLLTADKGNNIVAAGEIDKNGYGNETAIYAFNGNESSVGTNVNLQATQGSNAISGSIYAHGGVGTVTLTGADNFVYSAAAIVGAGDLNDGRAIISSLYAEDGAQISVSGAQNVIRTYAEDPADPNTLERTIWAYNTADITIDGQTYISTDRYEKTDEAQKGNSADIAIAAGTATGLDKPTVEAPVLDRATVSVKYDTTSTITGDILSAYAGQVDITPKNDTAQMHITGNILAGNNGVLNVNLGNGGTLTGRADDYGDAGVIDDSGHGTEFFNPAFSSDIFKGGEVNLTMGDNSRWNVTGQSWITRINTNGENALINLVNSDTDRNENAHALTVYEMNGDAIFNMSLNADRTLSDMVYMKNAKGEYVVNVVDPVTQADMYAGKSEGGIFDGLRFATVGKGSKASFRAITWDQGVNNIEYEVGTDSYDTSNENHHYDSSTGNGAGDTEKPGTDLVEGFFGSEGTPGAQEAPANGIMMMAARADEGMGTNTDANGTEVDETTNFKLIGVKSSEISDAGKTVVAMSRVNYANAVYMDRLNKRMGEARYIDGDEGLWVRMRHDRIGKSDAFRSMNTMMELGYDTRVNDREDGEHRQGVAIDYMRGTADYKNVAGEGDVRRGGIWFYDTWLGNKGHYTDYVLKFGRLSNDFELYTRTLGEKVTGDYSNFVYSASAEYGRKKDLGNNWYIEPQAQIQYAHVTDADYTTSQDTHVQLDAIDSLIGRVGFRLGKDVGEKSTFYVKADVLHEFLGDQDIEARDATGLLSTTYENEGTWYDIGLGFSHQFSKGTYMYLDMEKSIGNDNEDTYQFNFGMNWKV